MTGTTLYAIPVNKERARDVRRSTNDRLRPWIEYLNTRDEFDNRITCGLIIPRLSHASWRSGVAIPLLFHGLPRDRLSSRGGGRGGGRDVDSSDKIYA